jgi:arsenate reductase-like glutaredoxin family protein
MIKLYSLDSCSRCNALKEQLKKENIEFEVISDIEEIEKEELEKLRNIK